MSNTNLATTLQEYLILNDVSENSFAKSINMSHEGLHNFLSGKKKPFARTLFKIEAEMRKRGWVIDPEVSKNPAEITIDGAVYVLKEAKS